MTRVIRCAGRDVSVHKVGLRWHGVCPFHEDDTDGETFAVDAKAGLYSCFQCGACGRVADAEVDA